MGILKELTQALKNDPWIPLAKRGSKPSAKAAEPPKTEKKPKSFCDPASNKPCITMCVPREGCNCDCDAVRQALNAEIREQGLSMTLGNAKMGCAGKCSNGPFIGFPQKGFFYLRVQPQDVPMIVQETLARGRILFPLVSISPDQSFRDDVYFERESGFLGVIDEKISMVEVAKYFLDFEEGLSCGKCTPCRIGIKRLNESMERIASGEGTTADLDSVKMLCETMTDAPHCDFAAASSRPVLSAVTFFENEFRAVVKEVPPEPEPAKDRAGEKKNLRLEKESAQSAAQEAESPKEQVETDKEPEKTVAKSVPATESVAVSTSMLPVEERPVPAFQPEATPMPAEAEGMVEIVVEEVVPEVDGALEAAVPEELPPAEAVVFVSEAPEETVVLDPEPLPEIEADAEIAPEGETVAEEPVEAEMKPAGEAGETLGDKKESKAQKAGAGKTKTIKVKSEKEKSSGKKKKKGSSSGKK